MKERRIGVVMGGLSSEREVSLDSGAGVAEALASRGYDVIDIDWKPGTQLPELLLAERVEVVWNALHGTFGEDGAVAGLCACMGIACTGSGILASALSMDKVASKRAFEHAGLPTAPWQILGSDQGPDDIDIPLPVVIKPALEGSSVGVSIVEAAEQRQAAIALAREHRGATLVEAYLPGAEICTGILDGRVLGSCEIRPALRFYDYAAKYERDDTRYLVPPPIEAAELERIEALALSAHECLSCGGYSRVDFRIDARGEPALLEVNTLPGMTSHSLLPKIAAHAGLDYAELCEQILKLAA